jgi:hypothetical protein
MAARTRSVLFVLLSVSLPMDEEALLAVRLGEGGENRDFVGGAGVAGQAGGAERQVHRGNGQHPLPPFSGFLPPCCGLGEAGGSGAT